MSVEEAYGRIKRRVVFDQKIRYNTLWACDWHKWNAHWTNPVNKWSCISIFFLFFMRPLLIWWSKFEPLFFYLQIPPPHGPYNIYQVSTTYGYRGVLYVGLNRVILIIIALFIKRQYWLIDYCNFWGIMCHPTLASSTKHHHKWSAIDM